MFEKVSYIRLWTVVNEKLTIDDKQIARHNLSNPCLQKTWFYVILNDESLCKWILKQPLNLTDPDLDKSLNQLNLANQSLDNTAGEI